MTAHFGPYAQDDEFGSRVVNPMRFEREASALKTGYNACGHRAAFEEE